MPYPLQMPYPLEEYFEHEARLAINPEHAIVLGNAIYARFLQLTGRVPVA